MTKEFVIRALKTGDTMVAMSMAMKKGPSRTAALLIFQMAAAVAASEAAPPMAFVGISGEDWPHFTDGWNQDHEFYITPDLRIME